ncbi:MAG: hypothetical protein ACLSG9_04575 [Eubacterium sp.]
MADLTMDGSAVLLVLVKQKYARYHAKMRSPSEYSGGKRSDYYILHQAQDRLVDGIAQRVRHGLSELKSATSSYEECGNTSTATHCRLPFATMQRKIKKKKRVAGFTCAVTAWDSAWSDVVHG